MPASATKPAAFLHDSLPGRSSGLVDSTSADPAFPYRHTILSLTRATAQLAALPRCEARFVQFDARYATSASDCHRCGCSTATVAVGAQLAQVRAVASSRQVRVRSVARAHEDRARREITDAVSRPPPPPASGARRCCARRKSPTPRAELRRDPAGLRGAAVMRHLKGDVRRQCVWPPAARPARQRRSGVPGENDPRVAPGHQQRERAVVRIALLGGAALHRRRVEDLALGLRAPARARPRGPVPGRPPRARSCRPPAARRTAPTPPS